jgi:hypothetical protein
MGQGVAVAIVRFEFSCPPPDWFALGETDPVDCCQWATRNSEGFLTILFRPENRPDLAHFCSTMAQRLSQNCRVIVELHVVASFRMVE